MLSLYLCVVCVENLCECYITASTKGWVHPLSFRDNDGPRPADEAEVYTCRTHGYPAFIGNTCIYMHICSKVHIRDAVYAHVQMVAKPENTQSKSLHRNGLALKHVKRSSPITFIDYMKLPFAHLKESVNTWKLSERHRIIPDWTWYYTETFTQAHQNYSKSTLLLVVLEH